ncbi:MAG: aromatic ring-hydroxylating dioxygenase subunit alpha [Bacteroidia bacterium]|nr:aromatic ring-hydroxylating dioxygenase subunit alpha [Bacteroidia bacterium]
MYPDRLIPLLDAYHTGWSLPQGFYTDQAVFDLEWQHIWRKYWLFAGTTAEIPRPGDYITRQYHQDSVIIIRGDQGEVWAHHNSCRHRGSLICLEARGHASKLLCPYHQWAYNRDGSLYKARLMPESFDKSSHGLHPVSVREVGGLIFISLADEPPDFEPVAADYAPLMRPFALDTAKVAFQTTYSLRTNWKLVAENFRECYHCGPAHPEYCSAVIGANLRESAAETLAERRVAWAAKGLSIRDVDFVGESFHFAVRYPLRPGVKSYSTDGAAVSMPMGLHQDHDAGVLGLVVLPGFWMDAVSDYVWTMRVTPAAADRTDIELTWLVDGRAVAGEDYTTERLVEFWKITGEQDWALCENNFRGVESSRYVPGPYAPDESEVVRFVDWYIRRMEAGVRVSV